MTRMQRHNEQKVLMKSAKKRRFCTRRTRGGHDRAKDKHEREKGW